MALTIAAIRSGSEACGPLPPGSFHRWLEEHLLCPKCDVIYQVVVDYDASVGRWFDEAAFPLLNRLRRAIFLDHERGHKTTHFESSGVSIKSYSGQGFAPNSPETSKKR